jgi:large subunit ribosomal protein L22
MTPVTALDYLYYGKQKATQVLYQAVKSAISNAKQTLKVEDNLLKFKVFTIEQGQKLKRFRPGGRGTPKPILKKKSHIKIILTISKIINSKQQIPKKSQIKNSKQNIKKV